MFYIQARRDVPDDNFESENVVVFVSEAKIAMFVPVIEWSTQNDSSTAPAAAGSNDH